MKILIAPDSFKECLSAKEVAENIAQGILQAYPQAQCICVPVADGGEGTVQALVDATHGKRVSVKVHDPLMRMVDSFYGMLGDEQTAVIEMAAASGLELLQKSERNPWLTSTYGTGELIKSALDSGARKLVIGIGGSATNDGGAGMLQALGGLLLDAQGNPLGQGGGELEKLASLDLSGIDERLKECIVQVACDVTNPLCGAEGASKVYGPQKGADAAMVGLLDANLQLLAHVIAKDLGKQVANVPGAGAAGGLGAGLMAFLGGALMPGFEIVRGLVKLDALAEMADLVITGEGKMDYQTQFGKTPFGVAQVAKKYGKPVLGIAGTLGKDIETLYEKGFDSTFSITDGPIELEEAIKNAPQLLRKTAERIMRVYRLMPKV